MERRQFLGAAAALTGLPNSRGTAEADGGADGHADKDEGEPERADELADEYVEIETTGVDGYLDLQGNAEADVELTVTTIAEHQDGAWEPLLVLTLKTDIAWMTTFLAPDDAEAVAEAIQQGTERQFHFVENDRYVGATDGE